MLAGHLPSVWDQKSPSIDKIADEVKQFLSGKGVTPVSAVTPAVFVRYRVEGIERIVVDLQMPNGADLVKARVALYQLKATGDRDPKRALSFANVRSVVVRLRAPAYFGTPAVDLPRAESVDAAVAAPLPRRPGGGAKENFDLSTFYSNEGALADSDNNLIPDRVDVMLSADGDGADGIIDLGARLGLESTGVAVPLARTAASITAPESEPILVLVGLAHPIVEQLIKNNKWERPSLQPGEGLIQIVKKVFGEKSAHRHRRDAAGVDCAVRQLAEKFPHIWSRGKDRTTLDDVEDDVRVHRRPVAGGTSGDEPL
jgi:hypothetical protein